MEGPNIVIQNFPKNLCGISKTKHKGRISGIKVASA